MSGHWIGIAEEAIIADLTAKLAESQAREAKLREALEYMIAEAKLTGFQYEVCRQAVNEPQDDTALKEYRKEVLLGTADVLEEKVYSTEDGHLHSEYHAADELRRMAEE